MRGTALRPRRAVPAALAAATVSLVVTALGGASVSAEGDLDTSFGQQGAASVGFETSSQATDDVATQLALQPDGKLLAAGARGSTLVLARLQPDGSLDATFGDGGRFSAAVDGVARGLALQSDGKIVLLGGQVGAFGLLRLRSDGARDGSFGDRSYGVGGRLVNVPNLRREQVTGMALQADGKIVVAGHGCPDTGSVDCNRHIFFVARFTADGAADTRFGSSGIVRTDFATSVSEQPFGIAIQPDGKIVVAGAANVGSSDQTDWRFALARYRPNGALDTSFAGGDGKRITNFGSSIDEAAFDVTIQSDGKIVTSGEANEGSGSLPRWRFALARYLPNGELDPDFGSAGRVLIGSNPRQLRSLSLALQPSGRIVVVGKWTLTSTQRGLALVRLLPNGSPDPTFASGEGRRFSRFGADSNGLDVVAQPDTRIVVAGWVKNTSGGARDMLVARYFG